MCWQIETHFRTLVSQFRKSPARFFVKNCYFDKTEVTLQNSRISDPQMAFSAYYAIS